MRLCYNRIRQQNTAEVHALLIGSAIMAFADCRVHCRACCCIPSHSLLPIGKPHKGKRTSWYMACPLFLCPVYARQCRVYNIDQTKKAAEARPFRGILIHGDCTAWISVLFSCSFQRFHQAAARPVLHFCGLEHFCKMHEAVYRPMHGDVYGRFHRFHDA